MKKILFAIALLGMAFSCTMVNDIKDVKVGKNIIRVSSEDETRVAIQQTGDSTYSHVWEKGDAIVVYNQGEALKYEVVGEGGSTKADFAGDPLSEEQDVFSVFYPYSDCLDLSVPGYNLFEYTFPSVVDKAVENYAQNVMIGLCDGKNVQMKNCAAYIKFAFSTNIVSFVDSIRISALDGEPICGKYKFGIDGETGDPFGFYDGEMATPDSTLLIALETSEMLTSNTRSFYVALPPVGYVEGLRFTFYGNFNGEEELEFTSHYLNLERNVVIDFEEIKTMYSLDVAEVTIGEGDPVIYENASKAFESALGAKEPVVIKMLNPGTITSKVEFETEDITVDLNGKTLLSSGTKRVNLVGENAKLTIMDSSDAADGSWSQTSTGSYVVYASAGTITLESGIIEQNANSTSAAVYVIGENAVFTMNGGKMLERVTALDHSTVNINGGEIHTSYNRAIYLSGSPCYVTLNMTGGSVYAENGDAVSAPYTSATVNITGGEIFAATGRGIFTYGNTLIENCTVGAVDSMALKTSYGPTVTIKNAKLYSACEANQASTIYLRSSSGSGSNVTMENVTITNTKGKGVYAHGTTASVPCTLLVKGGTWHTADICVYAYARSFVTVEDGEFLADGDCRAAYVGSSSGNMTIKGGWFNNVNSTKTTIGRYNSSTALVVSGGYYTGGLPSGVLAEGYGLYTSTSYPAPYKNHVKAN